MLTAMGKMVQQIATINNLLIFINIQISQLQKSNEGRALGEGARYGRNLITPSKGREGQNSCQFLGDRGAPVPAPGPLIPDLWGLRGWGGWNGSISSPGQGQAPLPWAQGDQKSQRSRHRSQSCFSCLVGGSPQGWAGLAAPPHP